MDRDYASPEGAKDSVTRCQSGFACRSFLRPSGAIQMTPLSHGLRRGLFSFTPPGFAETTEFAARRDAGASSIVVAGLKKIDAFIADPVRQAVFLRDAP